MLALVDRNPGGRALLGPALRRHHPVRLALMVLVLPLAGHRKGWVSPVPLGPEHRLEFSPTVALLLRSLQSQLHKPQLLRRKVQLPFHSLKRHVAPRTIPLPKGTLMPPVKHAAKHTAKHAKNHAPEHDDAKDLRRAYEHLGRVEAIRQLAEDASPSSVHILAQLAEKYLEANLVKQGADLLRAAEHFSFAALAQNSKPEKHADPKLLEAVREEFDKLCSRAEDHWAEHKDRSPALLELFEDAFARCKTAFDERRYRQALELARGAEALAHINKQPNGSKPRRLSAA